MAERDPPPRGARTEPVRESIGTARRRERSPSIDPKTLLAELALSEAPAAGLAPDFDVAGLVAAVRKARPKLDAANLDGLIEDVLDALTEHLAARSGPGWGEVVMRLRVRYQNTLRLLEAAEASRIDGQVPMAPREEVLLRKVVELEARASRNEDTRKALLRRAVTDPLGYDAAVDTLGKIVDAAQARLGVLDQALAVLRSAPGRKSGGDLHPLVHRLGQIWKARAAGSFTYTRDLYDGDDIVKGAFPAFCFAAVGCLPPDQRPDRKLLSSTIRKVREKQGDTKRSA